MNIKKAVITMRSTCI